MRSFILLVPLLIVSTALLYGPEARTNNIGVSSWRNRILYGLDRGILITAVVGLIGLKVLWPGAQGLALVLSLTGICFVVAMYTPVLLARAWGRTSAENYWAYLQATTKWPARRLVAFSIAFPATCLVVAAVVMALQ